MNTTKNRRTVIGAAMAVAATLALVFAPTLPALAATTKYYDFGTYTSSPAGATADGSYTQHAIASTAGEGTAVHAVLYDTASDGKGATLLATINFMNSNGYFVKQTALEARELDGAGTHKNVDLPFSWPKGATKGVLTINVCNGKSGSNNLNCGPDHDFNL